MLSSGSVPDSLDSDVFCRFIPILDVVDAGAGGASSAGRLPLESLVAVVLLDVESADFDEEEDDDCVLDVEFEDACEDVVVVREEVCSFFFLLSVLSSMLVSSVLMFCPSGGLVL